MAKLGFKVTAELEPGIYDGVIIKAGVMKHRDTDEDKLYIVLQVIGGEFDGAEKFQDFRLNAPTGAKKYAKENAGKLLKALDLKSLDDTEQLENKIVKFEITDQGDFGTHAENFQKSDISLDDDNGNDSNANIPLSQSEEAPF